MHIKKVSIQNLRSIRNFEMEFEQPAGWHVLIGDNGAGKTTILRGMAIPLIGEDYRDLRIDFGNSINFNKNQLRLVIDLDKQPTQRFYVERIQYGYQIRPRPDPHDKKPGFSCSFGPFRQFSGGNQEWEDLHKRNSWAASHISLFREDAALTESLEWLKNLNYKRLEKDKEAIATLKHLKTFINDGELLPHGAKITNVSSDGVFLTDGNGQEISVNEMSDGFRSILSMTFEIIRQMVLNPIYGRKVFDSIKNGEIKIDVPGVVLIDEVDAHLHPTWQTEIGFWFTKYFPNIQFIVTTHSPLVCRACERGSIWRLAAPGSGEESREITGSEKERLIIGNILDAYGTELFGESPARAAKSDEKRKRLGQLNILHALGKIEEKEETERRELQKTFITE